VTQKKDTEQNHLQLAWPGLPLGDKRRFTLQAMNNILGGGMASRLFQQVRERNGLCYTIYSFQSGYLGTGVFGVYVALGRETEDKAIKLIRQVIADFLEHGCTQEELDRTITQLKANLLMGLEGTTARMNGMARNEFLYGRQVEPEELIAGLEAVTCDDVLALARELLRDEAMSFSAVGKVRTEEEYRALLEI
jgi:predicted Zn-dependent peptidase